MRRAGLQEPGSTQKGLEGPPLRAPGERGRGASFLTFCLVPGARQTTKENSRGAFFSEPFCVVARSCGGELVAVCPKARVGAWANSPFWGGRKANFARAKKARPSSPPQMGSSPELHLYAGVPGAPGAKAPAAGPGPAPAPGAGPGQARGGARARESGPVGRRVKRGGARGAAVPWVREKAKHRYEH